MYILQNRSAIEVHAATCEGPAATAAQNSYASPPPYSPPSTPSHHHNHQTGYGGAASSADYRNARENQFARENVGAEDEGEGEEQLCPICSETYPLDIIERHAARCGEVFV